jgi:hypothetical protein
MKGKKIGVLGTEYTIRSVHESEHDPKLEEAFGYTEPFSKEIIIEERDPRAKDVRKFEEFVNKTIRHEIVHAFLVESGLDIASDWAVNEEIVDWIARQIPRMAKAMAEVGAL